MNDDRFARLEEKVDSLIAVTTEIKTKQEIESAQNHREHEEFLAEIKALKLVDDSYAEIINKGKGMKYVVGIAWSIFLSGISGVAVWLLMR